MKQIVKLLLLLFILTNVTSCKQEDSTLKEDITLIKDGSGKIYTEMKIGEQIWLKEDLSTDKYIDGTPINALLFQNLGTSGFYYSNLADFNKICPKGYRIPTKADFEKLIAYLGGVDLNENQIIEKYVKTWNGRANGSPHSNGSGLLSNNGSGFYWTSTIRQSGMNYYLYFRTEYAGISVQSYGVGPFSIKCIKN